MSGVESGCGRWNSRWGSWSGSTRARTVITSRQKEDWGKIELEGGYLSKMYSTYSQKPTNYWKNVFWKCLPRLQLKGLTKFEKVYIVKPHLPFVDPSTCCHFLSSRRSANNRRCADGKCQKENNNLEIATGLDLPSHSEVVWGLNKNIICNFYCQVSKPMDGHQERFSPLLLRRDSHSVERESL